MENQKVKWLVQGHTLTFIWPHYLVKMLLLYQIIMPLFYTGILIKNNCVPVSSFWNFLLQKTWSIASQWAEWRFWLAPKSYTFCWASMPSSADLQRQPLVPNTGKFTWSIDHITMHENNEMKHEAVRSIYRDDSVFFGRGNFEEVLLSFQSFKKVFALFVLVWICIINT